MNDRGATVIAGPVRGLAFASFPCVGAGRHRPVPLITEQHHVFPLYLQARIWTDVDATRPSTAHVKEFANVCGNCHATVHVVLAAMLARTTPPAGVARKLVAIARRGFDAYVAQGGTT